MKHLRRFNESEENFSHEEENTLDLESKIIDIIKNETYTRC